MMIRKSVLVEMPKDAVCATCCHFFPGGSNTGACRANPPDTGNTSMFPTVFKSDWCGRHPDREWELAQDLRWRNGLRKEAIRALRERARSEDDDG